MIRSELHYKERIIRKTLNDLIEVSTIQGLPNLLKTKRVGFKILWGFSLVISIALCIYFVMKCLIDFLEYDYFTSIKSIHEIPAPFPAISICSFDTKEFELNILKITYKGRFLLDWKEHFHTFEDQMYGKCYTFNGGKNLSNFTTEIKNSTSKGIYFGLWLYLYVDTKKDFSELVVYIHNQTSQPLTLYNKGFYVSSGSSSYFIIDRIFEKHLGYPYNNCYKDLSLFSNNKTLINFILNKNQTYTQNDCIDLCRTMHYIETNNKCPNCILTSYDEIIYAKCVFNKNEKDKNCPLAAIERFQEEGPYKICADYCPLECDSLRYQIQQIYEGFPSRGNTTSFFFNDFKTYDNVSKNFFGLFFYYEDLKYTLITQEPKMQTFDLFSTIGGLLGLFLGMGLLSFVEIFHIFLETIILLIEK